MGAFIGSTDKSRKHGIYMHFKWIKHSLQNVNNECGLEVAMSIHVLNDNSIVHINCTLYI